MFSALPADGMVVIRGTGSYLPERVVTNDQIEQTSCDFDRRRAGVSLDEWVSSRIGVRSRHRAASGEGVAAMATVAARAALEDSGLTGPDLELIVLSTLTRDQALPPSASYLQQNLGSTAKCIQLDAACTGFIDGLAVATGLMQTLGYRRSLVVHSDVLSSILDERRFLMQAIFADGAGAVVLEATRDEGFGITALETFTDGSTCEWTKAGGGTLSLRSPETLAEGSYFLEVDTKAVFPFAVARMAAALRSAVEGADRSVEDVDWVIAHQTGINISKGVAEEVGIDFSRFLMTLDHTGNTAGATIPIALDHFNRLGRLAEGDFVVLPAVGAGMAWGAASCVWAETACGRAARQKALIGAVAGS